MSVDDATGNVRFSLDSKDGMPLLDFIKWAQQVTGKRFTFNTLELQNSAPAGNIHFIGEVVMARDTFQKDFYAFFQTMLYIKGFAVIPRGEGNQEVLEIVMMAGARGREVSNAARYVAVEDLADYQHQAGVPILTTVPLQHIDAMRATNALRPFFASSGSPQSGSLQIGTVGNKTSLLLQGFGPQVFAAAQLVKLVDTPQAEAPAKAPPKELAKAQRTTKAAARPKRRKATNSNAPAVAQDDVVTFAMKNPYGMELLDFVKWAQETTGKRFTYNPQELESGSPGGSKIHVLGEFQFPRKTFKQDFYAFFQSMLFIKGFAIVPRGEGNTEVLEIVMMHGHRGREITNSARYVAPEDVARYRNQTGVPILTTVQLQNINAQLANNALRPFFASSGGAHGSGSVQIGNVGNQSALLLQGFGPQVYAAVKLLRLVDVPAAESKLVMQVVRLEHRSATELESILNDVFRSNPQGAAQGYAGAGASQPKVIADESQAALILSGKQHRVREVLDMIARLDVPAAPSEGSASVVYLKHAKAEDVAATLMAFLADENRAAGARNHPSRMARTRRTVVAPHKGSNSLLISAPATKWKQIAALIDKLDKPAGAGRKPKDSKSDGKKKGQGFGFTGFGKATFQDTDGDGLPDVRLPDFERPVQGVDAVDAKAAYKKTWLAGRRKLPKGKSVIF